MGGILFKIFIYYMLFKVAMCFFEWLYNRGLPGLVSFVVETTATLAEPPTKRELAARAKQKVEQATAITEATQRLKAAQSRVMVEQAANNRRVREI
ncbi:hypothetical protein [Aeromonas phage 13AhydR10PP]|nr:hypothetical protein [Aeromonas phage 13AhydR10PP]